ncbi:MAG TPA: S41 family peptidase [Tissierellaceae bacterium]|nr:S41 family peptidase [Tissierellaceae bacterium]
MSKRRIVTISIILLIVTNIITFGLTNALTIQLDSRVIIPKKEYDELYSAYKDYTKVILVESLINEDYLQDVDREQLLEGQLKGMVHALGDPYSQYLTAEEYKDLMEQTSGSFGGIGVIVTPGDDNLITVVSPIEDTPGERAGIRPGDKIIKVDGVEYTGDSMDKAVNVMKGEPDTEVTLTIMRKGKNGQDEMIDLEIVREVIRIVTVKSSIIDDEIGYINLTSFDELTYGDFKKDLKKLQEANVKGLVLDLRNNPGGLLDACADIADEFLGEGVIVYTENKQGERRYYRSKKSHTDIPMVVLVNEGSASASEILAGAIKDHNRGELIGTKTFGKGIVQSIKRLGDGSGLKLTVSEYFTPKGINIHKIGIEPDIVVELPEDIETIGVENIKEDTQLQKALEVLKNKIQ